MLARVDHEEVPLYKVETDESEGDEELTVLQLKEDRLLAGFVPLLAAPQEPCYTDKHTDMVSGQCFISFSSCRILFLSPLACLILHHALPVHMHLHFDPLPSGNSSRL